MKVFKFGGASVKDAEAVKNVARILSTFPNEEIVVVLSAMGKTTNALEKVVKAYYEGKDAQVALQEIKDFHYEIIAELFHENEHPIYALINNTFVELEWAIEDPVSLAFDQIYDQIVSVGELLSSQIVSEYLSLCGIKNKWVDARDFIKTDDTYREGKLDWELSEKLTKEVIISQMQQLEKNATGTVVITQGFIGSTSENFNITLGREGSDYTAAIIAYALDAEEVIIWKDVPGVLNADPKWFSNTVMLEHLSYQDAIELAYYGATIIHPKTIKPLQNKNIPLYVKSFLNPASRGTVISNEQDRISVPSFIFKVNQILISISPKDFSFIVEENLTGIFSLFADLHVKINVMQNSAISFSVCCDYDESKTPRLIEELRKYYKVLYNENLELVTIRYYDQATIDRVIESKQIILEQKSRTTAQLVMKPNY